MSVYVIVYVTAMVSMFAGLVLGGILASKRRQELLDAIRPTPTQPTVETNGGREWVA